MLKIDLVVVYFSRESFQLMFYIIASQIFATGDISEYLLNFIIMRTSLARLGLGFGNLGVTIRGTTKYHISPLEQKAFAGAFSQGT